nr:MAG TPA: nonstructural protein 7 and 8/Replicase Coronavirus, nonstructural protein, primer-independent.6A [Caudoviricetes sp.]
MIAERLPYGVFPLLLCKIIFTNFDSDIKYNTTRMKKTIERGSLTDGELSIPFEVDRYLCTEKLARGSGYKLFKYGGRTTAEVRGKNLHYVRIFKHKHVSIGRCNCSLCEWRRERSVQRKVKRMNEKAEAFGEW